MRGSRRTAVVVILPLLLGRVLATPQTPQSDRARPRTLLGGARVIMELRSWLIAVSYGFRFSM